jgi:endonuclease/exonuclease/phosphatase family metal-dependent hydrolase
VSRFDVVAVQEVKGNLKALRHMLKLLNNPTPHWTLMLTDVNRGALGNNERLAFVFDTRRVQPSGLACEIVIPDEWLGNESAYRAQFARTPYAMSFRSEGKTFILVTVHILFGNEDEREDELWAIAEWLADWAQEENSWDHSLIALGDFNIDGGHMYEIFTRTGLRTPTELEEVPRTIFGPSPGKFYDQIAWFVDEGVPQLSLEYTGRGGYFDFANSVLTDLTNQSLSWRVSDHFPLWVEFLTREE